MADLQGLPPQAPQKQLPLSVSLQKKKTLSSSQIKPDFFSAPTATSVSTAPRCTSNDGMIVAPNRISAVDFMSLRFIFPISPKLTRPAFHRNISTQTTTMAAAIPKNRGGGKDETGTLIKQLVNNDSIGGWEKCWEQELTPWDLGKPTPILMNLIESGCLPNGRVLVPGCGTGYDVEAIASSERYAVGLDISEIAVTKARELFSLSKNANHFAFLKGDFFTWNPSSLFDLIFDYTFFCAIEPSMRPAWARRVHDLLKPDGELITLMFPIDDITGGPPYKVSVADYEEVLHPLGFKATSLVNNELTVGLRKGREKLGRWKRCLNKSRL